jgi:predicted metalloendopeptidase
MNSLNIPAGILQPPYFDQSWPAAVNYGATGASTVGHEMTHGFDDEGAKFDGHGNLKNWWAPQDLKKFRAATRCVAEQFSRYTVPGGMHVQGELGCEFGDVAATSAPRPLHPRQPHPAVDQQFYPLSRTPPGRCARNRRRN